MAIGAASSRPLLYLTVALFGLFVGAVDASMNCQAVAAEKQYGVSLLTGFHAVWSAAGILGGSWISLANRSHMSLTVGFAVPAAVGIAVALITSLRLYPKEMEAKIPSGDKLKAAAKRVPWRPIIFIGAAVTCMYIADSSISSYSSKYLENDLHAASKIGPWGYVAYQIMMMLSRAGADRVVRRYGASRIVAIGSVIGGLGLTLAAAATNPTIAIAGFAVTGLGLSVVVPTSFSAAGKLDPTGLGIAVARVNVFNYVGFVVGAAVAGAVASNLWIAYAIAAALTLVILACAKGFQPTPVADAVPTPPWPNAPSPDQPPASSLPADHPRTAGSPTDPTRHLASQLITHVQLGDQLGEKQRSGPEGTQVIMRPFCQTAVSRVSRVRLASTPPR